MKLPLVPPAPDPSPVVDPVDQSRKLAVLVATAGLRVPRPVAIRGETRTTRGGRGLEHPRLRDGQLGVGCKFLIREWRGHGRYGLARGEAGLGDKRYGICSNRSLEMNSSSDFPGPRVRTPSSSVRHSLCHRICSLVREEKNNLEGEGKDAERFEKKTSGERPSQFA